MNKIQSEETVPEVCRYPFVRQSFTFIIKQVAMVCHSLRYSMLAWNHDSFVEEIRMIEPDMEELVMIEI